MIIGAISADLESLRDVIVVYLGTGTMVDVLRHVGCGVIEIEDICYMIPNSAAQSPDLSCDNVWACCFACVDPAECVDDICRLEDEGLATGVWNWTNGCHSLHLKAGEESDQLQCAWKLKQSLKKTPKQLTYWFIYSSRILTNLEKLNYLTLDAGLRASAWWRLLILGQGGPLRGGVTPFNGNPLFKKLPTFRWKKVWVSWLLSSPVRRQKEVETCCLQAGDTFLCESGQTGSLRRSLTQSAFNRKRRRRHQTGSRLAGGSAHADGKSQQEPPTQPSALSWAVTSKHVSGKLLFAGWVLSPCFGEYMNGDTTGPLRCSLTGNGGTGGKSQWKWKILSVNTSRPTVASNSLWWFIKIQCNGRIENFVNTV